MPESVKHSTHKDKFIEQFSILYAKFNGTYDIDNHPEIFGALANEYYRLSQELTETEIPEFMREFGVTFPTPAQWKTQLQDFFAIRRKEEPKIIDLKNWDYGHLQILLVSRFWPLLGNNNNGGQIEFAKMWIRGCQTGNLEIDNWFKDKIKNLSEEDMKLDKYKLDEEMRKIPAFRRMLGYYPEELPTRKRGG